MKVGTPVIVVNSAANRATPFWEPLIGQKGIIVGVSADGLVDVSIVGSHPLIPGVLANRLQIAELPIPARVRIWERLAPTLYFTGITVIILLIAYGVPYCVGKH